VKGGVYEMGLPNYFLIPNRKLQPPYYIRVEVKTMTTTVYSTGEAARLLNVKQHKLTYAHVNGELPEPNRVFGRRAYTLEDIKKAAEYFNVTPDFQRDAEKEAANV